MGCCCSKEPESEDDTERTPLLGDKNNRAHNGVDEDSSWMPQTLADSNKTQFPPIDEQPQSNQSKDAAPDALDFKPIKVERYDEQMQASLSQFPDYFSKFMELRHTIKELHHMYPEHNTDQTIAGCFSHVRTTMGENLAEAVVVNKSDPTSPWITYKAESVHHSLLTALNQFNKASRLLKEIMHETPQLAAAVDEILFAEEAMKKEIVTCTQPAGEFVRNRCLDHCQFDMEQFSRAKRILENNTIETAKIAAELQVAVDKIAGDSTIVEEVSASEPIDKSSSLQNNDKSLVVKTSSPSDPIKNTSVQKQNVVNGSIQHKSDPIDDRANSVHVPENTIEKANMDEVKRTETVEEVSASELVDKSSSLQNNDPIENISVMKPNVVNESVQHESDPIDDRANSVHIPEITIEKANNASDEDEVKRTETVDSSTKPDIPKDQSISQIKELPETVKPTDQDADSSQGKTNEPISVVEVDEHRVSLPKSCDDDQDQTRGPEYDANDSSKASASQVKTTVNEEPDTQSSCKDTTIEVPAVNVEHAYSHAYSQASPQEPISQQTELVMDPSSVMQTKTEAKEEPVIKATPSQNNHDKSNNEAEVTSTLDGIKPELPHVKNGHTNGYKNDAEEKDASAAAASVVEKSSSYCEEDLPRDDTEQRQEITDKKAKKRKAKKAPKKYIE